MDVAAESAYPENGKKGGEGGREGGISHRCIAISTISSLSLSLSLSLQLGRGREEGGGGALILLDLIKEEEGEEGGGEHWHRQEMVLKRRGGGHSKLIVLVNRSTHTHTKKNIRTACCLWRVIKGDEMGCLQMFGRGGRGGEENIIMKGERGREREKDVG